MFQEVLLLFLLLIGTAMPRPEDIYASPLLVPQVQEVYEDPIPYQFAYAVKDDYVGADYGHTETSDGKNVYGSYSVQLPDGRRQTVNYIADDYGGYVAEVTYYGVAQYPKTYGPPITFQPAIHDNRLVYQ